MAFEFKLPDIGEGTVEGEIVRWLAGVGDTVKPDQPVVEVMTDKATVELTAPKAGKILEIKGEPGQVVAVGAVLYVLDDTNGAAPSAAAEKPAKADASAKPAAGAPPAKAPAAKAAPAPVAAAPAAAAAPARTDGKKPLAAPATRRVARELGVDLYAVEGSGPAGRITQEDVERAAQAAGAEAAPAAPAPASSAPRAGTPSAPRPIEGEVVRVPFKGIRKATAAAMTRSKYTATHFTYVDEVDMTKLVELRQREKGRLQASGTKLTYLPFIAKAAVQALKRHPALNAELDEAAQEILQKRYYHVGVSIQAEQGLYVGVVRDVDRLSVIECANEINRVIGDVRAGKPKGEDLKGSTFTITSAGNIGGLFATPIINFPEVAIMGVHQIKKRPVVIAGPDGEDQIAIRQIMYLSLSVDHRLVDGAGAGEFMNDVIALLEDPTRLLLGA